MALAAPITDTFVDAYLDGLKAVLDKLPRQAVTNFVQIIQTAREQGKQIFVVGNGGSAATASHMACDLGKTVLGKENYQAVRRFKVIALTDNVPLITAWGNDTSYDIVFAEQLRNLANPGDVLVVISASGNSPNILAAVEAASELGMTSIGLLGFDGGAAKQALYEHILIESNNYGFVEDAHMIVTHLITAYFKAQS